ncbi:tachylectin-related carbohydrate-binding protein [Actinokineospora diospyrosa]|uniref:Tachylectin n=1 Tax=Actinokineospora diospyrosa TaxID=103728 RepID=A0ABT1IHC7_9PSEU|nr:tachylectin-related carbohydrate-binding protein [Actinokineospora diospyrosa]MCP2271666.1 Tachylectin [Actinokineospora diospyrosa]
MKLTKYIAAAVAALSVSAGLAIAAAAPAAAAPPACAPEADVFGFESDGDLFVYPHATPESGTASWAGKRYIGQGWEAGTTLVGPDGVFYKVTVTGELRRYHWNGNGWDTFEGGLQYRVVGSGFNHYLGAHGFIGTIDSAERLYFTDFDKLRVYAWDKARGEFTPETRNGPVIDTGWRGVGKFTAAGDGVLYARGQDGELTRSVYRSGAWAQRFQPVGTGWNGMQSITSAGGDVVYGNTYRGDLHWYRFDPATNTWAPNSGTQIGYGWTNVGVLADVTSCLS